MKSLFDQSAREEILNRLEKFSEQSERKWGHFTPIKMLGHLSATFVYTFAEKPIEAPKSLWNTALGRWFVIDCPTPWPKGAPTAPVLLNFEVGTDFIQEKSKVVAYIKKFADGREQKFGPSPFLGNLSPEQWARLHHRHLDHHLRQFGL